MCSAIQPCMINSDSASQTRQKSVAPAEVAANFNQLHRFRVEAGVVLNMASSIFAHLVRHQMWWLLFIALAGISISPGRSAPMDKYFSQPTMDFVGGVGTG